MPGGRFAVARGGLGQRAEEVVLGLLEERRARPQERRRVRERALGGRDVVGEHGRLELSDPVPAGHDGHAGIGQVPVLHRHRRRRAAKRLDERDQAADAVDEELEVRLAGEGERALGELLDLRREGSRRRAPAGRGGRG